MSGTFNARARLSDAAVSTESTQIVVNGEVTRTLVWGDKDGTGECTSDCSTTAHYEYAAPETVKFGWTNADQSIGWGIKWAVEEGKTYTLTDETNALPKAVKCSTGPTWAPTTTTWTDGSLDESAHTLTFTPPSGSLVCVVYPAATPHAEGQDTYVNRATINGQSLEATATVKVAGGTDGDGKTKPQPSPVPSSLPKPDTKPTPVPTHSDEPQSAQSQTPEPTPTPTPTPETVAVEAPQARLARTGATGDGLIVVGAILLGATGLGLLILRLLEGPVSKEEGELCSSRSTLSTR